MSISRRLSFTITLSLTVCTAIYLSLFFSSSLLASVFTKNAGETLGKDSSWISILSSENYRVDDRKININGQLLSVFEVCLTHDQRVRSIEKLQTYAWAHDTFKQTGEAVIGKNIQHRKAYSDYDTSVIETEMLQKDYDIKVYDSSQLNGLGLASFEKGYTLPACETHTALSN